MTRGGKRAGAGRKNSEPTKQVRIPVSGAAVARSLVNIFMEKAIARVEMELPSWPLNEITITLMGVEKRWLDSHFHREECYVMKVDVLNNLHGDMQEVLIKI